MTPAPHVHTLSCTEPNCRLPVGRIIGNYVEILGKHHGEKHYAKIPLTELLKFLSVNLSTNLLTSAHDSASLPAKGSES